MLLFTNAHSLTFFNVYDTGYKAFNKFFKILLLTYWYSSYICIPFRGGLQTKGDCLIV